MNNANPLNLSPKVLKRINHCLHAKKIAMDGKPMQAICIMRWHGYTVEQAKSYLGIGAIMQGSNM